MGSRREGREAALRLLYQVDVSGDSSDTALARFWDEQPSLAEEARTMAEELVREVLARKAELDSVIDSAASNWQLDRIARIDLSLLRLAVCELLQFPSVPARAVVNEAIEIARKYSDAESPAFVNGVLDRVARERHLFEDR